MTIRLTFLCAPGSDAALDPFLGDAPLSDHSLCEARVVGAGLPAHGLVVRAPSIRCSQTAEALGLDAASEPALRDLDLGTWCGHSVGDVAATDPDGFTAWLTDPDAAPHEGESVRRLCHRIATWLSGVAPDPGHVLAITEAAVVRAALVHALAVPARAFWHISVPHLSTVSLTWRGGSWDVRLGHAPPAAARRWPVPRSAPSVPTAGDQPSPAHVGGGERSSSTREAIFASRG
ncbi:histidine phosphatase family protein [Streptomyces sp. NPDC101165]|uniref:histidine phosphatase family protein n=1 Tax=Streptomyces sp. NPDC101165 TaxID=3366119 RepID=UPI00382E7AA1